MGTLEDTIKEEPDRFVKKLDFEKIKDSKDSKVQFLKEIEKKFKTANGLRMWDKIIKDKELVDALFKSKKVQKEIGKGELEEEKLKEYLKKYEKKIDNYQKNIEKKIKLQRERGEKIKRHRYSKLQTNFIKAQKDVPSRVLASEFNRSFKTKLTTFAIRDKKARLLGKKK